MMRQHSVLETGATPHHGGLFTSPQRLPASSLSSAADLMTPLPRSIMAQVGVPASGIAALSCRSDE